MSTTVRIDRAGPLTTIQDRGRFGMLSYGIGESGPMDGSSFAAAGAGLARAGAAIEFTSAGVDFAVEGGSVGAGFAGGDFRLLHNGAPAVWPARLHLAGGDRVSIRPGRAGNYGYIRFDREIGVPEVLGSRATNVTVGLGGLEGRALRAGDRLILVPGGKAPPAQRPARAGEGPVRVLWGLHAELFAPEIRERFVAGPFRIGAGMDRMGVRLEDVAGVFAEPPPLGLVSDAVVSGDIQILGDGTPIVLMRDHQPTGGYPRIATIIGADLDRFAQLRPGTAIRFLPVTPRRALAIARGLEE